MKIISYVTFIIAIVSLIMGMVARAYTIDKMLFSLAALTYMRFAGTMFLLTINLLLFEFLHKKKV